MKAGKALNERKVEIRVQYKPPAASIHGEVIDQMRNELVVCLLGTSLCPSAQPCTDWPDGFQCLTPCSCEMLLLRWSFCSHDAHHEKATWET